MERGKEVRRKKEEEDEDEEEQLKHEQMKKKVGDEEEEKSEAEGEIRRQESDEDSVSLPVVWGTRVAPWVARWLVYWRKAGCCHFSFRSNFLRIHLATIPAPHPLCAHRNLLEISYSCTSAVLSDKKTFPTFTRTVMPLVNIRRVIRELFQFYSWKETVILSTSQYTDVSQIQQQCRIPDGASHRNSDDARHVAQKWENLEAAEKSARSCKQTS
jgi:hypothetical protein